MPSIIFYSWQSDLPNATNRGFIARALETATKSIRADDSITVEPVVDRDTAGVPGSPDIATTIFQKIEGAAVFVCDVSIINSDSDCRPTPNPNVLIELGYAKKALGTDRVLMIMNTAFGGPEKLPFDLRMRRVITYEALADQTDRSSERKKLETSLENALRAILMSGENAAGEQVEPESVTKQLIAAITSDHRNQGPLARRFMTYIADRINALAPELIESDDMDEALVSALASSLAIVLEFSTVTNAIAEMDSREAAVALYQEFGSLLDGYSSPRGFSGHYLTVAFDFHKFLGHELIVCLFSPLLQHKRLDTIAQLFDHDIAISNHSRTGTTGMVPFEYASQSVALLTHRNKRLKLQRFLHADILKERHSVGKLAAISAFDNFVDADFLLFLRSSLSPIEPPIFPAWIPWSSIFLDHRIPRFLAEAVRKSAAEDLLKTLNVSDIDTLRQRLIERLPLLHVVFRNTIGYYPLEGFDLRSIGTR